MTKHFSKYAVFIIAILSAELLVEYMMSFLPDYQSAKSPYWSTLVGMAFTVFIFYPAYTVMEKFARNASDKYVRSTKKVGKTRFKGMLTGFCIAFFFLFLGFAKLWYDKNLITDIKYWIQQLF